MYNVQPGITIDYATGNNWATDNDDNTTDENTMSATLVTDISQLTTGAQIVIVATNANYALGTTQNSNNRSAVEISKDGNTVSISENVQIITIGSGTINGTFTLEVNSEYLYAPSSSSNHLKTTKTLSDNASWSITISSNGIATIQSAGASTRDMMRFNGQNILFACYSASNSQQDVSIYIISNN